MTTRERREAKAGRRREWAEKREAKANATAETADLLSRSFPAGQPILVGHHSQHRSERRLDRMHRAMERTVEHAEMARQHSQKASNIEAQLDTSIFSDDEDAVERLRERIAGLEAQREEMKARNAEYRKAHKAQLKELSSFARDRAMPHPAWELSNLGGRISKDRKRLAQLEAESVSLSETRAA